MNVQQTVRAIERSLVPLADRERAAGAKAYLKSDLRFLGLTTAQLRGTVKSWLRQRTALAHDELMELVGALWAEPVHELRSFGSELLLARPAALTADDLPQLEAMLRTSFTWAYVDAIAVHLVGPLVARCTELTESIDRWAADGDFWIRRSALLALLLPLRRGGGDWRRFTRYADAMLEEKEFFIRKAIGWILREVGKKHPDRVTRFLAPRLSRVSGLTLREATKYLPAADRRRLARGSASRRRPRRPALLE